MNIINYDQSLKPHGIEQVKPCRISLSIPRPLLCLWLITAIFYLWWGLIYSTGSGMLMIYTHCVSQVNEIYALVPVRISH